MSDRGLLTNRSMSAGERQNPSLMHRSPSSWGAGAQEARPAVSFIDERVTPADPEVEWDITDLARTWQADAAVNLGLMLIDPTTDGRFRGIRFGSRDSKLFGFQNPVPGPRLHVELADGGVPDDSLEDDPGPSLLGAL